MSKELDIAKEVLVLEQGEEIQQAFKSLFFPTAKIVREIPRFGPKRYEEQEKRKDVNVKDGIVALTSDRIFWLEERGTFKKTYHPSFFIQLKDIVSMNMQGTLAKRMNIVSSQGEYQFRFGGMEKFIDTVSNMQKKAKVEAPVEKAAASPLEELKKLKELLDIGAITKEEYEDKKKKLLASA